MKILILTNEDHIDFVTKCVFEFGDTGHEFWFKYTGEYDWSEDYDIGISYMYQYRVPKEQLTKTWINFHPGLLPDYKGRNLCYWAIMNGATRFGATAHYMTEEFDEGCIIETFDFPVNPLDTAQELHDRVMEESQYLFKRLFPLIITGREFGCTPNEGGTYYKKEPIIDEIPVGDYLDRMIRAVTFGDFKPYIVTPSGERYKIVRDE